MSRIENHIIKDVVDYLSSIPKKSKIFWTRKTIKVFLGLEHARIVKS